MWSVSERKEKGEEKRREENDLRKGVKEVERFAGGGSSISPFPFPCCLFLSQENCQNEEILNSLKHVRPGGGFQPTFTLAQKCEVNGQNEHPVFAYLKDKLPYPHDDPFSLMTDPKFIIWSPVRRSDVSWNFEKFLIGPEGEPFRRYSRTFQTINIEPDIKRLLKVAI